MRVIIKISSKELSFRIEELTIFSLLNILYDLEDFDIEAFRANYYGVFFVLLNSAFIKLGPEESFYIEDLLKTTRSLYGSMKSYNCRRKSPIKAVFLKVKRRLSRFYLKSKLVSNTQEFNRIKMKRLFLKTLKNMHPQLTRYKKELIEYYNKLHEVWKCQYDLWNKDPMTEVWDDLSDIKLLALQFRLNFCSQLDEKIFLSHYLISVRSRKIFLNAFNKDQLLLFKLENSPIYDYIKATEVPELFK